MKNYKIQVLLILASLVLTYFLFQYEHEHDDGPDDPVQTILIVGAVYSSIFYSLLNLVFLSLKPLFSKLSAIKTK